MTHAPHSARLDFASVDDVAEALRRDGGRLTTPRRLVLETLFAARGPITAEQLAGERLELTSVYRALECLEQLGAVRHVHLGHSPGLYSLVGDAEREHLVCERCNRVTSVAAERLDGVRAEIERAFGYRARFSHFPIVGLCRECAAAQRD
jgi:Fur family ferric uptake transcriptional regulator